MAGKTLPLKINTYGNTPSDTSHSKKRRAKMGRNPWVERTLGAKLVQKTFERLAAFS
ncbi:hypothetical protein [Pseudomonas chlororaphis]|uniref:hypothetical protein n=1 Tax=Pseudomonas chlororaphis TaxID=587753 RepID=UPI001CF2B2F9|nr:hypothetical protein [Pseudomonas chlororaphis]UCR83563.1 hypothetical protein K9V45_25660 [Pseudomonas chlororaphis]